VTTLESLFDGFRMSAWRVEALPAYDVGGDEAERLTAWRAGRPRPERSVRTSPWLARLAVTTARGLDWRRVRILDVPTTDYQRYRLVSDVEAQACGEQVRLVQRPEVAGLGAILDVWLFDIAASAARAAVLQYDDAGHYLGAEVLDDPAELQGLTATWRVVWGRGMPLNDYLAPGPGQRARTA